MAGSYNRVILIGNLTRDPEIRYTKGGEQVTKFTLAVYNARSRTETSFINIISFGDLADICNNLLRKGQYTLVEGRLVIREYEDHNRVKRTATDVIINDMQLLTNRPNLDNESSDGAIDDDTFTDEMDALFV